jgi:hypothetical protein
VLIKILSTFESFNDKMFSGIDGLIESLPLPDYAIDAICDSIHLVPFLFIIFLLIEVFENYFSDKLKHLSHGSKKLGPLIGAILAGLPQCGFSVIATPLYLNKIITRGTLIAIYISTSDEAIPILLSTPSQFPVILPLLAIKIVLGISAGYLVDLILPQSKTFDKQAAPDEHIDEDEIGCCEHHIHVRHRKRELIFHPLRHTASIFTMILIISLGLNFCFDAFGNDMLNKILLNNSIFQPVISAFIGLIPNCAVSVLLTMLYMDGILSFASVVAGLSSGAGLGLIVLLKRNSDLKDSIKIIGILLLISIAAGLILTLIH